MICQTSEAPKSGETLEVFVIRRAFDQCYSAGELSFWMSEEQSMTNHDIAQKLALLPKGIAERNLQSWEPVVSFYKSWTEHPFGEILPNNFHDKAFPAIYKLVKDFSNTEQAKLFRGGTLVNDLFISTADEHGLKIGDRFVSVTFSASNIIIQYEIASPITLDENPNVIKRAYCGADDNLMLELQPFLDLLWDETRGKKNV